jgi:hypothetical protein
MNNYDVPETNYKADSQICDRYISFSSELLRLSLIAIGGYGTLVTIFLKDRGPQLTAFRCSWGLLVSVVLFSACAGATLIHRFYASDSMAWYLGYLRARINNNSDKEKAEKSGFYKTLNISRWALIAAECLFAAAVIFFIWGMYQLLFLSAI